MQRIRRITLLVLYQLTLFVGIALLPFAMVASRVGIRLPIHRAVKRLGERYDQVSSR